jgi:hypothetical protein
VLEVGSVTAPALPGTPTSEKLNVFISYSRADLVFADELFAGPEWAGFDPRLDRHAIAEGEDWKKRLGALIAASPGGVRIFTASWDGTARLWGRWCG